MSLGLEADSAQNFSNGVVRLVQPVSFLGKVELRRRWHVLPQLVAEHQPPTTRQQVLDLPKRIGRIVPEVQDVVGDDHIDWAVLTQAGRVAGEEPETAERTAPRLRFTA